ncbi:MAG: hypothetical protein A2W00_07025 [Candidatus Eisenbacteria bacterium RBG_16_71_46]|nr:MAG: hypothetical protein A2W00_07025 [Candidatus Eisenbacteria bacterium RBG_16_71_46]
MSEPRPPDPDDPSGAPPPPEHHHGLVEGIREEIEEVVEHVPKPVRWTVSKLAWVAVLSLLGLLVVVLVTALLYVANRTEWVAQELALFINQTLALRSDLVLEMKDIKGNPLKGVRVIEPRVRFRDDRRAVVLEAPEVSLKYSVWDFLHGHRRAIEIVFDRPTIRVLTGADGRVRLPEWRTGGAGTAVTTYQVRVTMRGGRVRLPGKLAPVEGLALDAFVDTGRPTRVVLDDLHWAHGPYADPLQHMSGELTVSDSLRFVLRELRTPDLMLSASGGWKIEPRGAVEARDMQVEIARVRWSWLAQVFDNASLDVPGEAHAQLQVRQSGPDRLRGTFRGGLAWNGLPVEGRGALAWDRGRLTLAPLDATSPAGDLSGRFEMEAKAWKLSGTARNGNPERWDAFHINGWPAGTLNGGFAYSQDAARNGTLRASLGGSELAGWRADSAEVSADFPADAPDSFRVEMLRRGGRATLRAATEEQGWRGEYAIQHYALDEWPDGRASGLSGTLARGRGAVEARSGGLFVSGVIEGGGTVWLGANLGGWRLQGISGRMLPTPDLVATASLGDVTFLGVHFDSARSDIRLGDRTLSFAPVAAHAGDTLVTGAGEASWGEDAWRIAFSRAAARSSRFDWTVEPPLELHGDPQGTVIDHLAARDGEARVTISGRWAAAPRGFYDWSFHAEDLDLARLGLPPDWGLAGRSAIGIEIHGPSGDPRWSFDAAVRSPGVRGHAADSLALSLDGAPGRLDVRNLMFRLGGGALSGSGSVERTAIPWPDTLTADGVLRWLSAAEAWHGTLQARDYPIDPMHELIPAAEGWSGRVSGRLGVGGRPDRPELQVEASAAPLAWQDYRADEVVARARYAGGRLDVGEIRVTRLDVVSTVSGALPLHLALGASPEFPEDRMSWRIEAPRGDLAVLPLFVPQIGSAAGRFDLSATIGGTMRAPKLEGALRIRDGTVRMAAREEVLSSVYADFRLAESRITLDSLSARQGDRGRVRGRGEVVLEGLKLDHYRFDLALRDFTAAESGLYGATFDGDFVVTNGPKVHGQTLPQVVGKAELQRARVLFDFANQSEMQQIAATTQPLFWTYRIQLRATDNLHWQPPDADLEFSADLNLEQTPDSLIIYGDMSALRGTYYFLSNRFTVNQADLTFDNVGGVNPTINAQATTRVVPARAAEVSLATESRPVPHDITVTIKGRANEPIIAFSSSPPDWDEPRILRELTVGRFAAGGIVALGDPLDNYLTRAINKTLTAEMSRVFQGYVNEWELDRERGGLFAGEGDVIATLGIPITSNIQVRYRQRLPGFERPGLPSSAITNPFERDIEAEYRLNRFFFVTTELVQRRVVTGATSTIGAGPEFNVNLKARWEY